MGTGVADSLDPVDRVELGQQLRERGPSRPQVAPVRVDVLTEQRDLHDSVGGQRPDLVEQFAWRTAHLPSASRRDDAVRACAIAPDADLHPSLEIARTLGGKMTRESLELKEPLRRQRLA